VAIVRVRGALKAKVGGQSELKLGGGSVADLLRELEQAQPDVRGWILDETGTVRRHINVFVNGELGNEQTLVGADDQVDVLPAISGG
jgi:molybdopterin synthase sulfur carrier subunit